MWTCGTGPPATAPPPSYATPSAASSIRLDPENLCRRAEAATHARSVRYWADDHGATGVVQIRLPADQARGVYAVIDTLARTAGDPDQAEGATEPRTLAQKRADTARDLILDAATTTSTAPCTCPHRETGNATDRADDGVEDTGVRAGGAAAGGAAAGGAAAGGAAAGGAAAGGAAAGGAAAGPDQRVEGRDPVRGLRSTTPTAPVRAEIRVTIPWETLTGHSDRPAEMEGHGPLPADLARRMAADPDSTWRRLLTDPTTGIAAHLDTRRYRPPPGMDDYVRSRDLTCTAPGCRIPATRCDLDHVIAYDHTHPGHHGGPGRTHPNNLRPCCRRHHRLKTHTSWQCHTTHDPHDGATPSIVWTSPSGHRWRVTAPALEPPPWDRDHETDHGSGEPTAA